MQLLARLDTPEQHTWTVCWHPNGKLIATAGSDRKITLWAAANNQLTSFHRQQVITGDSGRSIRSLQFSSDGKMLCAGSFDSTISIYVCVGGQYNFLTKLEGHQNEVKCVSWSPTDKKLASCSRDKNIYIWERNAEGDDFLCENVLEGHTQDVKWVGWLDNGTLISSSYDNTIKLWEYQDDDVVCRQTIEGHSSTVWSVVMHRPTRNLISIGDDGTLRSWGCEPNGKYQQIQCLTDVHSAQIYSIDINPTNQLLATGGGDGRLVISQLTNKGSVEQKVCSQQAHEGDVNCVRFNPQTPRVIATTGDDGFVNIWQL